MATAAGRSRTAIAVETLVVEETAGGQEVRHWKPADRLSAGDEVHYTIRVRNPGKAPVPDVVVTKRLPFGVHYMRGSAVGPACDVQFSVDGGASFIAPDRRDACVPQARACAITRTCAGSSKPPAAGWRDRAAAVSRDVHLSQGDGHLAEMFGPDGPLASALPGYARRDRSRLAMARAVAAALQRRETLIVEAGTGTGKTFAYLVPALLSGTAGDRLDRYSRAAGPALSSRPAGHLRRARPAGARRAAQGSRQLPVPASTRPRRAAGLRTRAAPRSGRGAAARCRAWSHATRRGDIAELPSIGEQDPVWPWVTSTRENCLGTECPKFEECFVLAARRDAQAADIVVVNHYLLMADLVMKEEGFGDLLPGADAIVIDEAHQLPDVAAQFLGYSVSTRQLAALAKRRGRRACCSPSRWAAAWMPRSPRSTHSRRHSLGRRRPARTRLEHAQWPERLLEALSGSRRARARDLADALATTRRQRRPGSTFTRLLARLQESRGAPAAAHR